MIKQLKDSDLNYKIVDLLDITRQLADLESKSKQPNNKIKAYFKDIELIVFTLYLEQIQDTSEKALKELESKGIKIQDFITNKEIKINPKDKKEH